MYNDLITLIENKLRSKQPVIVAICGYGGAGKSHLAERLAKHFGISERQILHMDNLHTAPDSPYNEDDIFSGHDWPLIFRILDDAQKGKRLQYNSMSLWGHTHKFDEELPKVLILEGVRVLREEAMKYFDVAVWINASADFATARGKARDRELGQDETHIRRWDEEWTPRNDKYFQMIHPDKLANFIYTDYK